MGAQWADYPIITRFYRDLDVSNHPTKRQTYQIMLRYQTSTRRIAPYVHFGYHITFGTVAFFGALNLEEGFPFSVNKHYIHGPLLGAGLEYTVSRALSFFVESTTHVTLMDDSVDGRLPLGPPQPQNHKERNRFGTFDLLSAVGTGIIYRPLCGHACKGSHSERSSTGPRGISMIRLSHSSSGSVTAGSYYYAFQSLPAVFFGVEAGLIPRMISVKYEFTDGQVILDQTPFTGAFIGFSTRWYPLANQAFNLQPNVGFSAHTPFQLHAVAGIDYRVLSNLAVGFEGRIVHCPAKTQHFRMPTDYLGYDEDVRYEMIRSCRYAGGVALTVAYRSH